MEYGYNIFPMLRRCHVECDEGIVEIMTKKDKNIFGNFYSPYSEYGKDMDAWYEAYKNDAEKVKVIAGKVYAKIIHRCEFYIRNVLLISVEPPESLKIGDILIDEYGREFEIKAFEMFRHSGAIPEWAFKISTIGIKGKDYTIGEYIAKK